MGHSQADKARTRERIVKVTSKKLREEGLAGSGLADLMKDAGVTVGAFYKHFASRDELVAAAFEAACGGWQRRLDAGTDQGKPATFADLMSEYLQVSHRDDPGHGCPFGALAGEVARSDANTRSIATQHLEEAVQLLTSLLPGGREEARAQAIASYAAIIGAMTLARLADDPALSTEILEATKKAVLHGAEGDPTEARLSDARR